jgi:hypothetical protein
MKGIKKVSVPRLPRFLIGLIPQQINPAPSKSKPTTESRPIFGLLAAFGVKNPLFSGF